LDTEGRVDRFMRKYGMTSPNESNEEKNQSTKDKKED
jgi:large subunit ribosomal protein L31